MIAFVPGVNARVCMTWREMRVCGGLYGAAAIRHAVRSHARHTHARYLHHPKGLIADPPAGRVWGPNFFLGDVMVALVCCLQRERDCEDFEDGAYMTRVCEVVHESCCVVGERLWNDDAFDDALRLMIDTGASTHMTNSRGTLMHDTGVACDV